MLTQSLLNVTKYFFQLFSQRISASFLTAIQNEDNTNEDNSKNVFHVLINNAKKIYKTFYHVFFWEICKSYQLISKWILLKKINCVVNSSNGFTRDWEKRKQKLEDFCDLVLEEQIRNIFQQENFWMAINYVVVNGMWLLRLTAHFDEIERKEQLKKRGSSGVCARILRIGNLY